MQKRGRGGGGSKQKQKKKQFYRQQQASSKRGQELKGGLTGFLATCDQFKEKRAVKELFNLLNDATERCYPELDLAELFAEHQRIEEQARLEAEKARAERKAAEGA